MPTLRYQRTTATVFLVGVMLGLAALVGRIAQINLSHRTRLLQRAQDQYVAESVVLARRGLILDARGRVVAASRYRPDVFVDATRVSDVDALATALAVRLHRSSAELAERIRRRPESRFVRVAYELDEADADAVAALRNPAVGLSDRDVRMYPLGESMSHVLGFVGRDGVGLEGIERSCNAHLRGQDGRRSTLVDARRRTLGPVEAGFRPPIDGGHVVLTIDAEIQRLTERAVDDCLAEHEAESGVAVVLDPVTGDVLAMACRPAYDPNQGNSTPPDRRRNRAITDPAEPGSAFKPFVMYGALEGGYIGLGDQIDCRMGEHYFGSRLVTDTSRHGLMDPAGILTYSSNIGMGFIGQRMGNVPLFHLVRRFRFGEPTGIELPGEASGLVRPVRRWGSMSAVSVAMGYEVSATPLQLVTAFSSLVNGGRLVRPRLVRQLVGPDGRNTIAPEPREQGPTLDAEIVSHVRDMLVSAIDKGTGRRAQLEHYRVMGKTGTPKLTFRDRGGYEPGAYQPTFVGAAPANDPRLAVAVTIRRPNAKNAYYGGAVAAPTAARILDESLQYLGVPADKETLLTGL